MITPLHHPLVGDPTERVAAAVIRAWLEAGDGDVLKVRVTSEDELTGRGTTIGVASTVDDAVSIVRAWLERVVATGDWPQANGRSGRHGPA